jgi:hypothetical protein
MNGDDCHPATHPSGYNSVHIIGRPSQRRGKNAEFEERYPRGRSHDIRFLMLVPTTHWYGCPRAQQGYAAGRAMVLEFAAGVPHIVL